MLDYSIVGLYLLVVLGLGLYAGRNITTMSQFAVSKRQYSSIIIFATLSASFIGGGFTTGNAEKVFLFGIVNVFALWGFSFKEMIVGKYLAPKFAQFRDAISVGDIMAMGFGERARPITGVLGFLLCAGIVGAQVGAIGYLFEVLLGIPQLYGIFIGVGIVMLYVTVGGIQAVVVTDVVQFFLLVLALPLTLAIGIISVGGIQPWLDSIPASHVSLLGPHTWWAFLSLFLVFMLGETLVPPYVQRLLMAKDPASAGKGTFWSGFFSIPFFMITGLLGLLALSMSPEINANLAIFHVVDTVLPIGLRGLVMGAILAVVMSSADSYMNAASVAITHDVIKPVLKKQISPKEQLKVVRFITIIIGLLAVVFATQIKSILDILLLAYNFWAPVILPPLLWVLLGYRGPLYVFIVSAVAGVLANLVWNLWGLESIDGLIVGVLVNAIFMFGLVCCREKSCTV